MPLYEVAFVKKPCVKAQEAGEQEELLVSPVQVIGDNEKGAVAAATKLIGDKLPDNMSGVEVLVRPFK